MRWNARVYLKAFDVGLQDTFVYRWNFFLRSIFELLPLMGSVLIWGVVFDQREKGVGGFDFRTVVAYFLIVLFLDGLVTPKDDEFRIAADIREGQISAFLVKPINYLLYRFSLFASNRLLFTAMTLPVFLILFGFTASYFSWPSDIGLWLVAIWTTAMAALLQFFITISIALLAFWMLEISTVVFIVYSFEYMLSGRMFPLAFMPESVQHVLAWLPFPYELYFPVSVLMNRVHGGDLWFGLSIQTFWVLAAGLGAQLMWKQGLHKYQAVGG
ncbi:MAG: ABC-2 family transporter protein [Verrucomicrobia bacterium]|nr:ABC-2 family transporter protein [Verrucomicrobiota bacterium]